MAWDRRRRALSRFQPVTAHTSSSIRPLSPLDALAYAVAYFLVISTLAPIDSSLPMPTTARGFRGHFHMRHETPFASIHDESRRNLDAGKRHQLRFELTAIRYTNSLVRHGRVRFCRCVFTRRMSMPPLAVVTLSASNSSILRELIGQEITALADVNEDALERFCQRSKSHDGPVRLACTGVTPADLAAGLRAVWSTLTPTHPDWAHRSDWVRLAPLPAPARTTGRWILLRFRDDTNPVPESICGALADSEFTVKDLEPSADAGQVTETVRKHVDNAGAPVGVLCLLPAAHEVTAGAERTKDLVTRALTVLQGCRHLDCRVWVITTAAVSAAGSAARDAAHAAVWGLGRAMGLEHPNCWGA